MKTGEFLDRALSVGLKTTVMSQSLDDHEESVCARIDRASVKYAQFLSEIYPEWTMDPSMRDTPQRLAKMYVKELFAGVHMLPPKITEFDNVGESAYTGIVFQGGIDVKSVCSHHIMAFQGKAFVAYIPVDSEKSKIIGLSKLNRLVDYCCRRPQVQEALTTQIHDLLASILGETKGIAVHIKASHTCVSMRGVNQESEMKTTKLSGLFQTNHDGARDEFYAFIK